MTSEERLQKLQEMEAQKPNDVFLKYAIALEYVNAKNDAAAQQIFESLVKTFPDYIATYYQLGKLHERNAMNQKAITIYQAGIELAKKTNDRKNLGELNEAIMMMEE